MVVLLLAAHRTISNFQLLSVTVRYHPPLSMVVLLLAAHRTGRLVHRNKPSKEHDCCEARTEREEQHTSSRFPGRGRKGGGGGEGGGGSGAMKA